MKHAFNITIAKLRQCLKDSSPCFLPSSKPSSLRQLFKEPYASIINRAKRILSEVSLLGNGFVLFLGIIHRASSSRLAGTRPSIISKSPWQTSVFLNDSFIISSNSSSCSPRISAKPLLPLLPLCRISANSASFCLSEGRVSLRYPIAASAENPYSSLLSFKAFFNNCLTSSPQPLTIVCELTPLGNSSGCLA